MKKIRLGLFPKFLLIILAVSTIPAGFIGYKLININRISMKRMVMQRNISIAENLAFRIDSYFAGLSKNLILISRSTQLRQMSRAAKIQLMKIVLTSSEDIETIALVDSGGNETTKLYNPKLIKHPFYVDRANDEEFIAAKAGAPAIGSVHRRDGKPVINVAYPFGNEVIFLTVRLDNIFSQVRNTKIDRSGYAFLVGAHGKVLAHPDKSIEKRGADLSNNALVKSFLNSGSAGTSDFVSHAVKKVGSYAPVETLKWGVITEVPYSEAYFSIIRMKRTALAWIAAAVILAALLSFFVARSVTGPILSIGAVSKKIAAGDFGESVTVNTHDELQDLAENFNAMSARLKIYNEIQIDKLIAEQTKTKAVILSIAEGIILTNYAGKILLTNEQAKRMLRLQKLEEGRSIFEYFREDKDKLKEFFREVVENAGTNLVREFDLSEGDYKRFAKTQTLNVRTEKNEEIGTVTVFRDITLEKEIDEMKDAFVHSITHDLRNPLTSIMGFMELLKLKKAGDLTEKQEKYLSSMHRESKRLLGMINDILDVAKLESGRMTLDLTETSINALVSNAIESLTGSAMKKNIRLIKDLPGQTIKITADAGLLQRVIINLMGNALNYTPSGGSITVGGKDTGDIVRVEVTDTGVGMPPEYCDKIFDKFQQVKGQSRGGTGLGLTISREAVIAHGGKIWAESEVGKGSRFIFEMPKTPPSKT